MVHVGRPRRDRRRGRGARRAGRAGRGAAAQPPAAGRSAARPAARRCVRGHRRTPSAGRERVRRDLDVARRRHRRRRAGDLDDASRRAGAVARERRRSVPSSVDGRPRRSAHGDARPGVAVEMLTSGTTGPPKRVAAHLRDALARARRAPSTTSATPTPTLRLRSRRHDRQLAARAPRRPVPHPAVRERRPVVLPARALPRRRLGRRRAPPPARARSASCRPRCAWCSTPTSTPPTSRASGRSSRAPRRCPRRRRRVPREVRRARADLVRRDRVRRRRRRMEPRRPRAVLGDEAGQRRPRRTPAASCASSIPTTGDAARPRRGGPARGEGRASSGDERRWTRTTDLARIDADGFLWILGRADQAIIRGGFKVRPDDVRAALERDPRCAARPSSAAPTRASARCRSRPSSCVPGREPSSADELLADAANVLARYELPDRAAARRRAAPHAVGQGRPRRRARRCSQWRRDGRDATRWTFGVEPLPQARARRAAAAARRRPGAGARARRPRGRRSSSTTCARAESALASRVSADPTPADRRRRAGRRPAVRRPRARHRRVQPVLPRVRDRRRRRPRAPGTVTFPLVFEGPPGVVHGGVLATFFDCVVQHHNCDVGVAGQDDVAARSSTAGRRRSRVPLTFEIDRDDRRPPHHVDARGCSAATTRAVHGRRWRRSPATVGRCRASRPGGPRTMTRDRRRRRRRPAAHRARAPARARVAERGDHPLLICDDDVLTYAEADARARPRSAKGAARGRRRARAPTSAILHPNGPDFVVAWLAAARIGAVSVPLSTFSTSAELRDAAAQRRHRAAARRRRRSAAQRLRRRAARRGARARPRRAAAAARRDRPSLRRIAFDAASTGARTRVDHGRAASRRGADGRRRRARRGRGRASRPSDRMVIVHTSGSTSEPKGVIHQHGPLHPPPRQPQRAAPLRPTTRCCSRTRRSSGSAASPTPCSARWSPARRSCARTRTDAARDARPARAGAADDGQRVRGVGRAPARRTRRSRRATSRRSGAATSGRSCPRRCGRVDPELRHNMLGMTEAGSVCLASDDESRPARAPPRLVRPAGPGLRGEGRRSRHAARRARPARSASCGSAGPFLMEGYYGRERHETFTPDGWYRTGDLVPRRRRRLLLLHRPARRHDQDRRRQRVAARGRGRDRSTSTGLVAHVVGIDDADRGQLVAAARAVPRGGAAPTSTSCGHALRERLSAYKVPQRFLVARRRRGADDVERQARRSRAEGAAP